MTLGWRRAVAAALGAAPISAAPLRGGDIADVHKIEMPDGATYVVKSGGGGFEVEAWMLRELARHLPVPKVVHATPDMLIIEYLASGGALDAAAERHAADLLAALHGASADAFGLDRDTLIGGLTQPNPWTPSWCEFFRDQRLLYMARQALAAGRLANATMARIEKLAARLDQWIGEPAAPSLIHGDMWTGNVLVSGGRISGFVDPAIYYADPEIELAFSTLFGTFADAFFARYGELRPIRAGFFEVRRDLYNLYPLLVHVRLIGGGYAMRVDSVLDKLGV